MQASKLFEDNSVEQIRGIVRNVRQDLWAKQVELRELVRQRYRTLLECDDQLRQMQNEVNSLQTLCSSVSTAVVTHSEKSEEPEKERVTKRRSEELKFLHLSSFRYSAPELIWRCLDAGSHFEAAVLLETCRRIDKRISSERHSFPTVSLDSLAAVIGRSIARDFDHQKALSNVAAEILLSNLSLDQAFRLFLDRVRDELVGVKEKLPRNGDAVETISLPLLSTIEGISGAIIDGVDIFFDFESKERRKEEERVQETVLTGQLVSIIRDEFKAETESIPESLEARFFLDSFVRRVVHERVKTGDVDACRQLGSEWLSNIRQEVESKAKKTFSGIQSASVLVDVRSFLFERVEKLQMDSRWRSACFSFCGSRIELWTLFLPNIVACARQFVKEGLSSDLERFKSKLRIKIASLSSTLSSSATKRPHVGARDEDDFIGTIWGRDASEWVEQQVMSVDPEVLPFVAAEGAAFAHAVVDDIQSLLNERIEEREGMGSRSTTSDCQEVMDEVIWLGRLARALATRVPRIREIASNEAAYVSGESKSIPNLLHRIHAAAFFFWSSWLARKLSESVTSFSREFSYEGNAERYKLWQKISVKDGEVVNVPGRCSPFLSRLLFEICREFVRVRVPFADPLVFSSCSRTVVEKLLSSYNALVSALHGSLTQNDALQLVFDIQFMATVVARKEVAGDAQIKSRLVALTERLFTRVDPIDRVLAEPYLFESIAKHRNESRVLFGVLAQESVLSSESPARSAVDGSSEIVGVLPLTAIAQRFHLLPVSVPAARRVRASFKPEPPPSPFASQKTR